MNTEEVRSLATFIVLGDIAGERRRQNEKFPDQELLDGTDPCWTPVADAYRSECDIAAEAGILTWRHILLEETFEALAETDEAKLREELVQTAAVITRWVEDIDRRHREVHL